MVVYCEACGGDMAKKDSCDVTEIEFPDGVVLKRLTGYFGEPTGRCFDCNIAHRGYHHIGCDVEQCPRCGGQLLSCGCLSEENKMTIVLKNYTTGQLQLEIDRRGRMNKIKTLAPKMKKNPDFTTVMNIAHGIVDEILDGSYHVDNNDATWIYEEVMIACFSKRFFDWVNNIVNSKRG